MTESFSWSANAGRWMGIPVRVHMFLLLFIAAIVAVELNLNSNATRVGVGTSVVTIVALLVSIAIHELAHLFTIANLGGHVNRVVLMPWGGNSDLVLPTNSRVKNVIYLAGPFVNGVIFLMGATLLVQNGHSDLSALMNPFKPFGFDLFEWQVSIAKIVTWVNFQLLVVNLIPCFPFDGANLVRSTITGLNYGLPKARIESAVMVLGHAVAFTMIGLSLLLRDYHFGPVDYAWTSLLLGGIVLVFAARYSFDEQTKITVEDWEDEPDSEYESFFDDSNQSGFDFSMEQDSVYSQWLVEKQEERLQLELQREEEEDRLADDILKKLHGDGISSLSPEERLLLDRVSARIRRRRQQGV